MESKNLSFDNFPTIASLNKTFLYPTSLQLNKMNDLLPQFSHLKRGLRFECLYAEYLLECIIMMNTKCL